MATDEKMKKVENSSVLRRWFPIVLIAVIMVVGYTLGVHEYLSMSSLIRNRIRLMEIVSENLLVALASYCFIYILVVAISVPGASILTISGGFLFGWVLGGFATALSATLGASIIFFAAKSSFGESLRKKAGPKLSRLSEGFRENAFHYLLFLRLVPLFPFWLINIAPALFNVPIRTYAIATFIGIFPGTFVYSFIGTSLDSVIRAQEEANPGCGENGTCSIEEVSQLITPEIVIAIAGLGILAIIPVILKKIRERKRG